MPTPTPCCTVKEVLAKLRKRQASTLPRECNELLGHIMLVTMPDRSYDLLVCGGRGGYEVFAAGSVSIDTTPREPHKVAEAANCIEAYYTTQSQPEAALPPLSRFELEALLLDIEYLALHKRHNRTVKDYFGSRAPHMGTWTEMAKPPAPATAAEPLRGR